MNANTQRIVTQAATEAALDLLAQQPWWKRYAGTITTAAGVLATFLAPLAVADLGLGRPVQVTVGVLAAVAAIVAARATKNGQTPRTSQVLIDAIIPTVTDALTQRDTAPGLEQMVRDQAQAAADAATRAATEAATAAIIGGPGAVVGSAVGSAEAFLDMLKRGAR